MNAKNSQISRVLDGNSAVAEAFRQINPDVVAAYPITPSTKIPEKFSEFVAAGKVETEFVPVESEHSAMSACVGAAVAGGRAMTATASQGLLLMHEVLASAAGMRLPIVLANACRAISAPLSIHGDHSDAMAVRDSGWIQLFARDPQEAYDLTLTAIRIAEHPEVRTPAMVCFDGFETSHLETNLEILSDDAAKKFVGEAVESDNLLETENPKTFGAFADPDFYFEFRRAQLEGLKNSEKILAEIGKEFAKISGREIGQPFEKYKIDDAEIVAVVLGSAAGQLELAVDLLREKGAKVGLLRIRLFRPFPAATIAEVLQSAKKVAVFERVVGAGDSFAPLAAELVGVGISAEISNHIFGVGQRQFRPADAARELEKVASGKNEKINFVNLRE